VQELYLFGGRKKWRCFKVTPYEAVIRKTRAGNSYLAQSMPQGAPYPLHGCGTRRFISGARLSRSVLQFSGGSARPASARGVRRSTRDRPRANCDAGLVQPRWLPDICVSGGRAGARREGHRCFRRCITPRSGPPTSSPTSQAPSFFELLHGRLEAGRPDAKVCPRPASSGSFLPTPVAPQAERKRHDEHCDSLVLAW
jgi:hypothetical protein